MPNQRTAHRSARTAKTINVLGALILFQALGIAALAYLA
jgi:hypothetical protein